MIKPYLVYRDRGIVTWQRNDYVVSCVSGRKPDGTLEVVWFCRLDLGGPLYAQPAQEISRHAARLLLWPDTLSKPLVCRFD